MKNIKEILKQFMVNTGETTMGQKVSMSFFYEVPIPKELLELKKEMKKPV